ncbi:MAG: hypothetical protein ABR529_02060 [Actinomycetota bacterium]
MPARFPSDEPIGPESRPPGRFRRFVSRRRRLVWISAAVVVGLSAVVLVWFQPQKLVIDEPVKRRATGRPRRPG